MIGHGRNSDVHNTARLDELRRHLESLGLSVSGNLLLSSREVVAPNGSHYATIADLTNPAHELVYVDSWTNGIVDGRIDLKLVNYYNKAQVDAKDLATITTAHTLFEYKDTGYTKSVSDGRYIAAGTCYNTTQSDARYANIDTSYSKAQTDAKYATLGDYIRKTAVEGTAERPWGITIDTCYNETSTNFGGGEPRKNGNVKFTLQPWMDPGYNTTFTPPTLQQYGLYGGYDTGSTPSEPLRPGHGWYTDLIVPKAIPAPNGAFGYAVGYHDFGGNIITYPYLKYFVEKKMAGFTPTSTTVQNPYTPPFEEFEIILTMPSWSGSSTVAGEPTEMAWTFPVTPILQEVNALNNQNIVPAELWSNWHVSSAMTDPVAGPGVVDLPTGSYFSPVSGAFTNRYDSAGVYSYKLVVNMIEWTNRGQTRVVLTFRKDSTRYVNCTAVAADNVFHYQAW